MVSYTQPLLCILHRHLRQPFCHTRQSFSNRAKTSFAHFHFRNTTHTYEVGYDFSSGSNSEGVRLIGSASLRWRLEGATSAIGGRQTRHAKEVADTVAHHIGKTIRTPRVSLALLHTFSGGLDSVISQVVALVGARFGSLMLLRGLCVTWPSAGSGCGYIRTGIFPEQRDQPQFAVQMPAPNSVAIALPLGWVHQSSSSVAPPNSLRLWFASSFPFFFRFPGYKSPTSSPNPRTGFVHRASLCKP